MSVQDAMETFLLTQQWTRIGQPATTTTTEDCRLHPTAAEDEKTIQQLLQSGHNLGQSMQYDDLLRLHVRASRNKGETLLIYCSNAKQRHLLHQLAARYWLNHETLKKTLPETPQGWGELYAMDGLRKHLYCWNSLGCPLRCCGWDRFVLKKSAVLISKPANNVVADLVQLRSIRQIYGTKKQCAVPKKTASKPQAAPVVPCQQVADPIPSLQGDVVADIFGYLDVHDVLCGMLVSKNWRQVLNSNHLLWRSIYLYQAEKRANPTAEEVPRLSQKDAAGWKQECLKLQPGFCTSCGGAPKHKHLYDYQPPLNDPTIMGSFVTE